MTIHGLAHTIAVMLVTCFGMLHVPEASAEERELDRTLRTAFEAGRLSGLHSVLVIYKGEVLAESYFEGEDERWGQPLGLRRNGPQTLHDLRSVTKPIVSLLYGIALSEGKVPGLDDSVIDRFPRYTDLVEDTARRAIKVRHVLAMQMGTQWNENLPYTSAENSEIAMEMAEDRYRFVLDRPIITQPGQTWVYNGGAVALIAKLIEDGVGMPIDAYAEQKLFQPLGIRDFEWVRGADGVPAAASGLRLNIHDLAKIGRLILQKGNYDGVQVVPEEWLTTSFAPRSDLDFGLRYGYFWWLAPASMGNPPSWVAGFGNGGQRLTIQPRHDLIVAIFAGNYNQPDDWQLPVRIIEEFMVPAVRKKMGVE